MFIPKDIQTKLVVAQNEEEMGSYKKTEEMMPRVEEPKPPNITHDILLFSTRGVLLNLLM